MIYRFVCILLYLPKSCSIVADMMFKIMGEADSLVKKNQLFFPRNLNLFTFSVVNINFCISCQQRLKHFFDFMNMDKSISSHE